ncbi:MAG: acyl-ACP desaturase [Bacteroidetes bacterium]|nr:acyl-ACP desaturase [Bacteroidota bacterium]
MGVKGQRLEVMRSLEPAIEGYVQKYLLPVDNIWQPADFLPDSRQPDFTEQVKNLQGEARELDYDFWIVLIGDMITEEALPSYESWLMGMEGVDQHGRNPWSDWVRQWTAEENRHGDVLNKYLYLSGRVNMREVEISTQYLLSDGFDLGLDNDPFRNFVYTSFQELATHISHKRVGELAAAKGIHGLARMCRTIAGDEMRHHLAYREFVKQLLSADPSGVVEVFADMMKQKIAMPANLLRQSGETRGQSFPAFADAAQRLGVYTASDYIDILKILLAHWQIDRITGLNDKAEKSRDYLMALPARLAKLSDRMKVPAEPTRFKWVDPWGK